jgi:hypothetical protein
MRTRSDHFGPVTIRCTSGTVTPWEVFPDQHGRTPGSPRPRGPLPGTPWRESAAAPPGRYGSMPGPRRLPRSTVRLLDRADHADHPAGARTEADQAESVELRRQRHGAARCAAGTAGPVCERRQSDREVERAVQGARPMYGPQPPRAVGTGPGEEERGEQSEPLRHGRADVRLKAIHAHMLGSFRAVRPEQQKRR